MAKLCGRKFGNAVAALACLFMAWPGSGCLPRSDASYQARPVPAMIDTPAQEQPGYWQAMYDKNRPEAPREYHVFPEPPRNNEFAEFDNDRFQGLDSQPALPPLPADPPLTVGLGSGVTPPPISPAQAFATPPAPTPAPLPPQLQPTRKPAPQGVQAGAHFYPVEQLVYGGDYPDIDKPESYRFMPKDVITVAVRDHPEFSGQLEIQPDGTIRIPNAHDLVRVRGLTADEAAEAVRRTIAVYVKGEPVVRVQANRARGGYYYVFGEVAQPGRFPMGLEPVRLSEAVLAANWEVNPSRRDADGEELGPAFPAATPRGRFQSPPTADLSQVVLITPHRSQPVRTVHDVRAAMYGVTANDPLVRPGQIVVVPSTRPGPNQEYRPAALPQAVAPTPVFGYETTPASLPRVAPTPEEAMATTSARDAAPPGDMSWIESVPRENPEEPEEESLVMSAVDTNMAAAFATSMNTSAADLQSGITVEPPTIIHLQPGEKLANTYPERPKVVRRWRRGGGYQGD